MCSVVANSLNFVEGAQIHHPLGRCCAFSEGGRMSGGHPFARTEAERRPCRGQSATSYPTQGAGTLLNKRQAFCYKGATLPSAVKRTAYPSELCVQMKSQKDVLSSAHKVCRCNPLRCVKGEDSEERND